MKKNSNQISTEKLFPMIRQWASEKGIYAKGDVKTQILKLNEEVGELSKAVLQNNLQEIEDAIGDCVVVLTNVAELVNLTYSSPCDTCGGTRERYVNSVTEGIDRDFLVDCEDCSKVTIEYCLNLAYNVIKNRTGKMQNGTFVKDK